MVPFLIIIFIISHFFTQQNISWCYYQSKSRLPRTWSLRQWGLAWTSSLTRAGWPRTQVAAAWPRSPQRDPGLSLSNLMSCFSLWSESNLMGCFSLWSDGFLSLFYFIFLFLNLDFRLLLGVDLVVCFGWSVFVFCTPTLAEISRTNWAFERRYINWVSNTRFTSGRHVDKLPPRTRSEHENRPLKTRFIVKNRPSYPQDASKKYSLKT